MKNWQFWTSLLSLVIITLIGVGNYLRWWDWRVPVGPITSTHWLGVVGAGYLVIVTPIYSYIRHHSKEFSKKLLAFHVFGNLMAFLLITIHYTQQAGRPEEFAAVHSSGLILFIIVAVMVLTGFLQRFRIVNSLMKTWRFTHVSLFLSLYIVLVIHVLQFFDIL